MHRQDHGHGLAGTDVGQRHAWDKGAAHEQARAKADVAWSWPHDEEGLRSDGEGHNGMTTMGGAAPERATSGVACPRGGVRARDMAQR